MNWTIILLLLPSNQAWRSRRSGVQEKLRYSSVRFSTVIKEIIIRLRKVLRKF
jgi:hypothetical protein